LPGSIVGVESGRSGGPLLVGVGGVLFVDLSTGQSRGCSVGAQTSDITLYPKPPEAPRVPEAGTWPHIASVSENRLRSAPPLRTYRWPFDSIYFSRIRKPSW
jgi:hypothetical protein